MKSVILGTAVCTIGVFVVFWLYRMLFLASKKIERVRLHRTGRVVESNAALGQVLKGAGYFIIATSRRNSELFFAEGEIVSNPAQAMEGYRLRAALVELYPDSVSIRQLQSFGVENRCFELNWDSFGV
jgi:hypothetical protein